MFKMDRRWLGVSPRDRKRIKEMRLLQKQPEPLLKKAPFKRIVRDIMIYEPPTGTRFFSATADAYEALRAEADNYLHGVMELAAYAAEHRGRKTVSLADIDLVIGIKKKIHNEQLARRDTDND